MIEDRRQIVINLKPDNTIVHVSRGRETVIARYEPATETVVWKDADRQASFHKPLLYSFTEEKLGIKAELLEGQKPDVLPPNCPPEPPKHFMQGDLTPAWLAWLQKYKPVAFTNLMGVKLRSLKDGEKQPADIRELWVRADVVRTDTRPAPDTYGGEYISTRFKMKDQIIARRASHLTFTEKEIDRGDSPMEQAEPYDDPYEPRKLDLMEKRGEIEIVKKIHAAASAGSNF